MKRYLLNEDKPHKKIAVKFSNEITNLIEEVDFQNQFEIDEINSWHDYIDGMISWISNPTIAWDNTNKYDHDYSNNITHIKEHGYDITFIMDTSKSCILIIDANLKIEEYGLTNPSHMYENKKRSTKKVYHIKESKLRQIIRETIREILYRA